MESFGIQMCLEIRPWHDGYGYRRADCSLQRWTCSVLPFGNLAVCYGKDGKNIFLKYVESVHHLKLYPDREPIAYIAIELSFYLSLIFLRQKNEQASFCSD